MSLKPARDSAVDSNAYTFTVIQITPKIADLAVGDQKQSASGVPLWTVDCLRTGGEGAAVISVTVPAPTQPKVLGPAVFDGLRVGLWLQRGREGGGLYWTADAVHTASAPLRPRTS